MTVHIDQGMWWRYPNEEFECFNREVPHAEQKFSVYMLENFYFILNDRFLHKFFPDLWGERTTHEQEYTTDLCLTVPSILVMIDKHEQAIDFIKVVRKFSKQKDLEMHAKLDLMRASIYIHKNSPKEAQEVLKLLERAKKGFRQFGTPVLDDEQDTSMIQNKKEGHLEGLAESYFTEAQLYIRLYKNLLIHEAQKQEMKRRDLLEQRTL